MTDPIDEDDIVEGVVYGRVSDEYITIYTGEYNIIHLTNHEAKEVLEWIKKVLFS